MKSQLENITDEATESRPTRAKRGRFSRIARALAVPAAALAFAAVQAPVSANAATSAIGSASATVSCLRSGSTEWMVIRGAAIQSAAYGSQYVTMRAGYTVGSTFYTLPWLSKAALVSANKPTVDAYGNLISVGGPQTIAISTTPRIANGSGRVTAYVQAGFWDGHAYEYTGWVPASYYAWTVNGANYTGGPVACAF